MTIPSPADFDTVFKDSYRAVVRATWLVVGDAAVAPELAQDAFLEALRSWKSVSTYDNPGAWVRRVAINKALNAKARKHPRLRRTDVRDDVEPVAAILDVQNALAELSPNQRAAVVLHHGCDLSVAEVAEHLGCSIGSAKTHLHRGRVQLIALLDEPSHQPEEVDDE